MKKKWLIFAASAIGLCWIQKSVAETKNLEKDMTPGKASVMGQIMSLMSDPVPMPVNDEKDDKAYLQVINGSGNRSTLIYRCRNIKSKNIIDAVENVVSKSGLVEEVKDENLLIVNDESSRIEELRKLVLALDVTVPQILVEAKVIEVYTSDKDVRNMEWDYNKGTRLDKKQEGTTTFPVSGDNPDVFNFTPFSAGISGSFDRLHYFLNWLKTVNDAKILSSPNLTVSLNSTASIVTAEDLPIQSTSTTGSTVNTDIKYKRTGIQLEVTPLRINSDSVRLRVYPEVSTVTRYESFNETRTPVVSVRNVKTELTVKNGEVIMLGGLYSSEELKTEKKVPYLGDIPYLGWLFRATDNSTVLKQLIFLLKVNIIYNGNETFVDLERQAENLRGVGDVFLNSSKIFPKILSDSEKKKLETTPAIDEKKLETTPAIDEKKLETTPTIDEKKLETTPTIDEKKLETTSTIDEKK